MIGVLLLYGVSSILLLIGITIYELRVVAYRRDKQRHPHARRWRMRPIVFADAQVLASHKTHYRKFTNHTQAGEYTLDIKDQLEIPPETLLDTIQFLIQHPNQKSISITPLLLDAQTFTQLLHNYQIILSAPLNSARTGLSVPAARTSPIVLSRTLHTVSFPKRTFYTVYNLVAFSLKYISCFLAAYTLYIAIATSQTEPLTLLLIAYDIYLLHAIWSYPRITLNDKIAYSLLAPASLMYVLFIPAMHTYSFLHLKIAKIYLARHRA